MIDEEVSRIIAEQYERAKEILRKYAAGHAELADVLLTREVIFTEDVRHIFGDRPWRSRTDEIIEQEIARQRPAIPQVTADAPATSVTPPPTMPPYNPDKSATKPEDADKSDDDDSPEDAGKSAGTGSDK